MKTGFAQAAAGRGGQHGSRRKPLRQAQGASSYSSDHLVRAAGRARLVPRCCAPVFRPGRCAAKRRHTTVNQAPHLRQDDVLVTRARLKRRHVGVTDRVDRLLSVATRSLVAVAGGDEVEEAKERSRRVNGSGNLSFLLFFFSSPPTRCCQYARDVQLKRRPVRGLDRVDHLFRAIHRESDMPLELSCRALSEVVGGWFTTWLSRTSPVSCPHIGMGFIALRRRQLLACSRH